MQKVGITPYAEFES